MFWGCFLLIFIIFFLGCGGGLVFNEYINFDWVSLVFSFLTILLTCICFYVVNLNITQVFLLCFFIIISFCVDNVLWFYFFFEASLLPLLWMIGFNGKAPERLEANFYFLLYTLVASFPMLILILGVGLPTSFSFWGVLGFNYFYNIGYLWFSFFFLLVFLVKLPAYGFHLWLPKAHVEAPTVGSMLLAGLLLKLATYGLIRFSVVWWAPNVMWGWFVVGLCFSTFICFRMSDYKVFIAYSSVSHMGVCLVGFFSGLFGYLGVFGVLLITIGHGFISAVLFFFSDFYYSVVGSRMISMFGGILGVCSISSILFFIGVSLNISIPPIISFCGEVFIFGFILSKVYMCCIFFLLYIFGVGLCGVYLYTHCFYGQSNVNTPVIYSFNYFCLLISLFWWGGLAFFFLNYFAVGLVVVG